MTGEALAARFLVTGLGLIFLLCLIPWVVPVSLWVWDTVKKAWRAL